MNQILYTGNKKSKGPLSIQTVGRIFAVMIILFGMILVGQGSYAIFVPQDNEEAKTSVPVVTMAQQGNEIIIKVTHDKLIDKVAYMWNKNQEVILQGKGRNQLEERIEVPEGENSLTLKVTDIAGKEVTYTQTYTSVSTDTIKPEIEFTVENAKVKISAKDETQLDYISYHWNDEDETILDAREESPKLIEEKVAILKGENTLKVKAVDKSGNVAEKEQTFKGAKKPTIELSGQGNELIIKVTDEENIKKIEFTLNGVFYSTDPSNTGTSLNVKELEIRQTLVSGRNTINVKVYNVNDLVEEKTGEVTI
ncbi:MAG: hypothetical protein ACLU84_04435 [Clostridia bacterium]